MMEREGAPGAFVCPSWCHRLGLAAARDSRLSIHQRLTSPRRRGRAPPVGAELVFGPGLLNEDLGVALKGGWRAYWRVVLLSESCCIRHARLIKPAWRECCRSSSRARIRERSLSDLSSPSGRVRSAAASTSGALARRPRGSRRDGGLWRSRDFGPPAAAFHAGRLRHAGAVPLTGGLPRTRRDHAWAGKTCGVYDNERPGPVAGLQLVGRQRQSQRCL